jgi:glycosyltransferase involved in cell wall biosynthesis
VSAADAATSFLFVTQYFPPERGAAQVRLAAVTREVQRRGHAVDVVTSIPNYPTGRFFPGWSHRLVQRRDEDGIGVVRVWVWPAIGSGIGRIANFLSFGATSLVGFARAPRADWTVVEYPTLFGALPAVVWCRLARRQVVVNVADLWVDASVAVGALPDGWIVAVLRRMERWMLRRADVVNAVTEGLRDELVAKGVEPERIAWLPNGADTEMFRPGEPDAADVAEVGLAPGEKLLVYAGTHGYVHGLDVVLDAADLLRDEPVRFLLVGGGSEKEALVADARRRDLGRVVFWDPVAPERVASLLKLATGGLACTRKGDLYRSIRSAKMFPVMAAAKPVLYAGDDEGAAMVAEAGAGWTTPAGDAPALAAAIRELLASPEEGEARGRRGREHVVATSSWRVVVDGWLDHLERWRRPSGRRR